MTTSYQESMQNINRFRYGTTWEEDRFEGEAAFRTMRAEFADAVATHSQELHESFYTFAGQSVRFRILGSDLAQNITLPFSHLRTANRNAVPQLTIDLWDESKSKGGRNVASCNGDVGWHETTVQCNERFVGQQLPHTFSCLDRATGHIMASIAWHDRIFIYERAKPLARLLLIWHHDRNVQIIHTGLVARDHKGLLFAGKSGSGKSTASLACIIGGFDYLSEDYVGLQSCDDGTFLGHSVYNSVFLNTEHLERFRELAPHAIRGRVPHELKSVVILSQVFPEQLQRVVPIRALALLRVADVPKPKFRPASKGEALLALGPSSLLQIPNRGLGVLGFKRLGELVESVPCYWLEVGGDLGLIAQQVKELLAKAIPS